MAASIGIIELWWKGTKYAVIKGASLKLPGVKNNDQPAGYELVRSQEFQAGSVRATVLIKAGMSLAALNAGAEAELQVKADTGQIWTFPDAFITENPELSDDGGKAPVVWHMSTYSELTNA